MIKNEKYYDHSIDILRSLAILGVVLIHTTTTTIQASQNNLIDFSFSLFLNQTFRFAVPMFFIISGYLLELNYDFHKNIFTYLKKRIVKIIVPYIFWSFLYYSFIFKNQPESFITALLNGQAAYHLYFVPALFVFYLIFPILHKNINLLLRSRNIIILLLIQIIPIIYDYYFKPLPYAQPVSIVILNYFYFIFGLLLANKRKSFLDQVDKLKSIIIPIILLLVTFIFTEGQGRYYKTLNYLSFYSQWRPSILIYTILLTIILIYYFRNLNGRFKYIKLVSEMSYIIYFVHIYVLYLVWTHLGLKIYQYLSPTFFGRIIFDPILFMLVAGLSYTIAYFLRKIPYLWKIIG